MRKSARKSAMARATAAVGGFGAPWSRRTIHGRSAEAVGRLRTARRRFDASVVALRKAALDHVDGQQMASIALHAVIARIGRREAASQAGGSAPPA